MATSPEPTRPSRRVERLRAWYERLAFPPARQAVSAPARPRLAFQGETTFVSGINLPWLAYGCDFGASAWRPDGGVGAPGARAAMASALDRLADGGHRVVRWFVCCDGRSGIRVNERGAPAGLDDFVRRDLDAAAEALTREKLRAVFVLFDFLLCRRQSTHRGVPMGGRRAWLARQAHADALLESVVGPLVSWLGQDSPVAAWDLFNEPEWVTWGLGGRPADGGVSYRAMRRFLGDATAAIRSCSPFPVTVGLASACGLDLVRDIGLDVYQVHWYDQYASMAPLDRPVAEFRLDAPILLGEYPTRASGLAPATIVETARHAGYAGALAWSARSHDQASDAGWSPGPAITGPGD